MENSYTESVREIYDYGKSQENEKLIISLSSTTTANGRSKVNQPIQIGRKLGRKILLKFVLLIMSLFFFAAAYVQHNDPDPYLWMPVYLLPFLMNVLFCFYLPNVNSPRFWNFFNFSVIIHICYCFTLGFLTIVGYASVQSFMPTSIFPPTMSEPNMNLEEAKELLGLCLVIAWMAFLYDGNFLRYGKRGIIVGTVLTGLPILAWIYVEKIEEENIANNCE